VHGFRGSAETEDTKESLRALRQQLVERRRHDDDVRRPRVYYPVSPCRRATNALVVLEQGTGSDPAALAKALKFLRKQKDENGLHALMARDSHLWGYYEPSERRRRKSSRARARVAKAVRRRAAAELRRDPHGRRPTPRMEVVPTPAA
jgi:ribosomal protein S21